MKTWQSYGKAGCLVMMLTLLGGCSRQDTDRLAKIGKIMAQRAELVLGGVEDDFIVRWQQAKERRYQNQLARQISKRLESDKRLADCKIDVYVEAEVVELKGTVRDLVQRQRAIDLAESTTGVTKVKDSLIIAASP